MQYGKTQWRSIYTLCGLNIRSIMNTITYKQKRMLNVMNVWVYVSREDMKSHVRY